MVVAALRVVTTKNIVHAALYLVVVLAGVAALFVLTMAEFTAATQVRFSGEQFDDDLNTPAFVLGSYAVWDATVSRQVVRGVHGFVAIENILDKEFDTARTPIRSIGWPRTVRVGARITWQ